ncbi:LacI family DNA-binding transcriptional regulator [Chelativorans sp.]|uniref:LacI family DNA-binding transcriptional regulator n=1 Tax=Chelativorans sp. TaxID=2203393 RepID=UPI002810C5DC|nr:LacI family DNA-binding transcriptional regulator [Chelativorans sp.]
MIDVARHAGVSQATVSLVLNHVPNTRIAAETRRRVVAAAEELGYRKQPLHAPLDHNVPVIGLLIDELTSTPFAAPFLEGARDEAAQADCVVATFSTRGDQSLEDAALDVLMGRRLVGILYTTLLTRPAEPPERLRGIPTVLLNCYDKDGFYPSVVPGDVAGGHAATEALLRAGHRRIAHIGGESWIEASGDRIHGYRQALATWDVPFDPELLRPGGWTLPSGRSTTRELLAMKNPPTAIFCFNDRMAWGAYEAIRERGLRIPLDVSVVGFDDEELSSYLDPPLTTVDLPHDAMARWAVGQLLDNKEALTARRKWRKYKMECALVERASVGTWVGVPA